jgi:hypothetical protein
MTKDTLSRRTLLRRGVQLPLGSLVLATGVVSAASAAEKVCVDMKTLDSGAKSIRDSLHYVEMSPDPAKTCGACGFFTEPKDGCGSCMIFQGPANAKGHCESWSPKG